MKTQGNLASMLGSNTQLTDPTPSFITLTPATIVLGHGSEVFQLCNITRIGKYRHKSKNGFLLVIAILAGLGALGAFQVAVSSFRSNGAAGVGVFLLIISALMFWMFTRPGLFAFGFECSSGAARYVFTPDEKFIDDIVKVVSSYMEDKKSIGVQINIHNRTITQSQINAPVGIGDESNVEQHNYK